MLREVFALGYDEIAEAVDKSPAAVRQIAHRERAHVAARRPREVVSQAEARDALGAFRLAVETGDLQGLLDIIAPAFLGDGGGVKQTVLRPHRGGRQGGPPAGHRPGQDRRRGVAAAGTGQWLPGADSPAQRRDRHRRDGTHRRRPRHGVYAMGNPQKLSHMERETALRR